MTDIEPAEFSVHLSSVTAAGVSADGRGFVRFIDGGSVSVSADIARSVAGVLATGAETFTHRTRQEYVWNGVDAAQVYTR